MGEELHPAWHGWIPAVIPAGARRFRVAQPDLAEILRSCGASVVDTAPDVEIGTVQAIRGDSALAVVVLDPSLAERDVRLVQIAHRLVRCLAVRLSSRSASRALAKRGFPSATVVTWDIEQRLRVTLGDRRRRPDSKLRMAERLPRGALVVAWRSSRGRTVFEDTVQQAAEAAGEDLSDLGPPMVRASGVAVALAQRLVLRVAMGSAQRRIDRNFIGLELVRSADLPLAFGRCVPQIRARGMAGLARWSLETKLEGQPPRVLSESLMSDCLDFLVALHGGGRRGRSRRSLPRTAALVSEFCRPEHAQGLRALAGAIDRELAGLPRGLGHGDFWKGNILAADGRLCGVLDWDTASGSQLPFLDLFNLLVAERECSNFGRGLVNYLLPVVRSAGNDPIARYCERVGVERDPELLEALAIAWWLERAAYELETYRDRRRRPAWLRQNVELVVAALLAEGPRRAVTGGRHRAAVERRADGARRRVRRGASARPPVGAPRLRTSPPDIS